MADPQVAEGRDLRVEFDGKLALDVAAIRLEPGRVFTVMGPNGSGKSTLAQVRALLREPQSGELRLFGQDITGATDRKALRRRMGTVFQAPLLLHGTVRKNVLSGLKIRGVDRKEAERRAHEWMERLRIIDLAEQAVHTLSAGEAQRTSLARAFVLEPELLLLDEPFSALDIPTREQLLRETAAIIHETAGTTLFVTHDRIEALTISHELAVMIDGRIAEQGPPGKIFGQPTDARVADFVGVENVISAQVVESRNGVAFVRAGDCQVQVVDDTPVGTAVHLCMRPEDVALAKSAGTNTSVRNAFAGTIAAVAPHGSQVRVEVDCGFRVVAYITRLSTDELGLQPGVEVVASFKASAAHLIER